MELLHDAYTWIIFSFALFLIAAIRFGLPTLLASLDSKIKIIRDEVETAARLKTEAQALLLEFEQRQRDSEREADSLIAHARATAEDIRQQEEESLNEIMKNKEQQLVERIALLRDQTVTELRQIAATLAFEATHDMIVNKIDPETRSRLVDRALEQIQQKLN